MVTTIDRENSLRIGEVPLLDILYPSAVNSNRHIVLRLAGDGARVTTDALSVVDDESKIHENLYSKWVTTIDIFGPDDTQLCTKVPRE